MKKAKKKKLVAFMLKQDGFMNAFSDINKKLRRVKSLYPAWPEDLILQTAKIVEEAGKAVQEAAYIKRGDQIDVAVLYYKLSTTACMCVLALNNLEELEKWELK